MTDLHTHILPGMDDGAPDVETSLAMLREEARQGVDTVVLTPHFYRDRERPEHFLARRARAADRLNSAIQALPGEERRAMPRLILGAEVAWVPNLAYWEELPRLCMGASNYLLLELPFSPWNEGMVNQLYDLLGRTGITPILAHLERYRGGQRRELMEEVVSLGFPVQFSADALLHPLRRGRVLKELREAGNFLASDCHNLTSRPPNLGKAMEVVRRKLGPAGEACVLGRSNRLAAGL